MEGSERFSGEIEEPSNEHLPRSDVSHKDYEQDRKEEDARKNEVVMEPTYPEEDLNSSIKTTKKDAIQNTEENKKEITEQNAKDSFTEENETETLQKISITDNFLKEEEDILNIDDQSINNLSEGLLHKIQPEIDSFSSSFEELTRNQRVLMETVQQENVKLTENKDINDLSDMVADAKVYYQKLVNIKKDMLQLHEKTTKIKKRALKLQGQKMKQNLLREQQRDHELEQERKLIAQPAVRKSDIL